MRPVLAALLALGLSPAIGAAESQPDVAQCLSCHGVDGRALIAHVPIIHGQQPEYLRYALRQYRDGLRSHGRAPVMAGFMRSLSDAQIDALAAWFGNQRTGQRTGDVGAVSGELAAIPAAAVTPAPQTGDAPSADRLVYLDEDEGWRRAIAAVANRDFFALYAYVESERFLTFCSIASMAAVLNSLDIDRPLDPTRYPYPFFTQDNLFILSNQKIKSFEKVVTDGLTLEQIGGFLEGMSVRPTVFFADALSADAMRARLREGLENGQSRVIVNYDRAVVGQTGSGHVSPVGAYDAATDSFLVLDVAPYKYPPAWIPFEMLYRAMQSVDSASGRARGIVTVEAQR